MKSDISIFHRDAAEGQAKLLASTICPLLAITGRCCYQADDSRGYLFYIQLQPVSSKPWSQ